MKPVLSFLTASLVATSALVISPATAGAAEVMPISQENVQAAISQSKPILYHVHAGWCAVCVKQNQVLDTLLKEPAFKDYVVLKVDFDKDKRAVEMLNAKSQSTLVVAKGANETGRAVGMTDPDQIRALLLKAGS